MIVPLAELKDGDSGVVTSIEPGSGRGRDRLGHGHVGQGWRLVKRLTDMGLTPGTHVTVVQSALFHGPLEVLVRGSRLALGRGMAAKIFVDVDGCPRTS